MKSYKSTTAALVMILVVVLFLVMAIPVDARIPEDTEQPTTTPTDYMGFSPPPIWIPTIEPYPIPVTTYEPYPIPVIVERDAPKHR